MASVRVGSQPPTASPLPVPRVALVASQDRRVLSNGVNSHSRVLVAALSELGAPPALWLTPVDRGRDRRRMFVERLRGRLARAADVRVAADLALRARLLADALRRELWPGRADVIHAQDYVAAVAALDALGSACPPLVLAHHANGLAADELVARFGLAPDGAAAAWARVASGRALDAAARVVAVSPWAGEVLAAAGVGTDRLRVVPNGVAIPPTPDDARRQAGLVVGVGQLVARKGFDLLVEAMAALPPAAAASGARAVVLGDGPARPELVALAQRLGAPVEFPGARADVGAWLARANVFALPSRAENLPMALLEAMAHGVAVVASDVGAVANAVGTGDEAAGIVVPAEDAGALTAAIAALVAEPARARALGRNARRRAEARYSARAMAEAWLDVYREAAMTEG